VPIYLLFKLVRIAKTIKVKKKNGNTCLEEQQNDVQFPVPASYVITYIHWYYRQRSL